MIIAALCIIVKLWKQPKCPAIDERIKKRWYICVYTHTHKHTTHTEEYYSAMKKNEILQFATMRMNPETITLSEIRKSEKDKYHVTSLICAI